MEQQGSNKQFFVTKFVFKIHLAANDEERRGKNPRKNKEKIQFIYLTLKSGKKTIRGSSAFLCLARETWF